MLRRLNTQTDDFGFPTRNPLGGADKETLRQVRKMLDRVRRERWDAVVEYSLQYDSVRPRSTALSPDELGAAWEQLTPEQQRALRTAARRIRRYQEALTDRSTVISDGDAGLLGEVVRPCDVAGCYIPGGRVPLPSTVLMTALVAEVAGVDQIVVCSPPGDDGVPATSVQAACSLVPRAELYGVGGVQAVGAMAYGAGSIPPVDVVAGPGNLFVTLAKKEVFGEVEIDLLAGPSEIAIVAEIGSTRVPYLATDLLSQAEHDPQSRVYLFSPDGVLLDRVQEALERLVEEHPREREVRMALEESALIRTLDVNEAVDLTNDLAPEHLELHVAEPLRWSRRCENAGAVFCGPYTPEPVGDYLAGPSHTLPTGGSARFFSPLSVRTFTKRQSLISMDEATFRAVRDDVATLADLESLPGHGDSIRVRDEGENRDSE